MQAQTKKQEKHSIIQLCQQGNYAKSLEMAQNYQSTYGKEAALYEIMAVAHANLQEWEKAISTIEKALALVRQGKFQQRYFELLNGFVEQLLAPLIKTNAYDQRIEDYANLLLSHDKNHRQAINYLAIAFRRKGKMDEAIGLYQNAIERHEDTGLYWMGLGMVALQQNDLLKTRRMMQTALALEHNDTAALNLAVTEYDLGEHKRAMVILDKI